MKILSHSSNFLLRLRDDGLFELHSDLVALHSRARVTVKAGTTLKKAKAKRSRAVLIRKAAKGILAARELDDFYIELLRQEGAKGIRLERLGLYLLGVLKHQRHYLRKTK
jgi:hypothetical protein